MTTLTNLTAAATVDNSSLIYGLDASGNSRKFTYDQIVTPAFWCGRGSGDPDSIEITTDRLLPSTSLNGCRFLFEAFDLNTITTPAIEINGGTPATMVLSGGSTVPVGYLQDGLLYEVMVRSGVYYLSQYASGATAETFTPTVQFETAGDSSFVYTKQLGVWSLSGRVVTFQVEVDFTTNAYTTPSGALQLLGLPLPALGVVAASNLARFDNFDYQAGDTEITAHVLTTSSPTAIEFRILNDSAGGGRVAPLRVPASTQFIVWLAGSYIVA